MRAVRLALAAALLLGTSQLSRAQEATEEPGAATNPNPLSSLSLESLSATRSLPLFTPSRTAPVVAEAPVDIEPEPVEEPIVDTGQPPPPLQLVGIVMTETASTALLLDSNSQEVHRLSSGDEFEGWSMTIVDARSVEFRSGERVESLRMFESFSTPPAPGLIPQFPDGTVNPDVPGIPGLDFPQAAPGDPMLPPDGSVPPLEGENPPVDFDPALGTVPVPEEGPLPPDANVNQGPG
jgi:hypothetical protein